MGRICRYQPSLVVMHAALKSFLPNDMQPFDSLSVWEIIRSFDPRIVSTLLVRFQSRRPHKSWHICPKNLLYPCMQQLWWLIGCLCIHVTQDKEVAGIIENVYSKFKQMLVNKVLIPVAEISNCWASWYYHTCGNRLMINGWIFAQDDRSRGNLEAQLRRIDRHLAQKGKRYF